MKKWELLKTGKWMITGEGGNSMLPIMKSGQKVVLKPMPTFEELSPGDIVYSRVAGNFVTHEIKALGPRGALICNHAGFENGWTKSIFGKVVGILTKRPSEELKELVKEGDEEKILDYIKNNEI
jgi:hypothetical protein